MAQPPFIQSFDNPLLFKSERVVCTHAKFQASEYHQQLFSEYEIESPAILHNAVIKRKAGYLAGRYVARDALKKLTQYSAQIPTSVDRAPIWPEGIIGSITHTNTEAMAAVAYSKDHQLLGLDLEEWIDPNLAQDLAYQIIDEQERAAITESGLTFEAGLTIIFSAKESLYKALYPLVKTFFGFEYARVSWIAPNTGRFEIALVWGLNEDFSEGWKIQGQYSVTKETVLTFICA
ncbi:4'-phosphopantetheinyl transferase superfamily protein [Vibrio sp. Of7-15]|uniref:4'-phosphopantetheinyl transferase family protein n=1 Tax=Vibrio sp. Of7-15 TaxID=2724879 RepID=UPI001EF1E061|nr:4'-phosphopantetheinyl transferase superfamily protein [Vibrio sp. Of7-15]MCG7497834.1 4'-phosphopantetheinyl transferase superfamily protein [Vibrio sp. Of7-15]